MRLIHTMWNSKPTFRMIHVSNDSPYIEAIFDPQLNQMVLITKEKRNSYHMVPKLNDDGALIPRSKPIKGETAHKEERRLIETFVEHYLIKIDDISAVVEKFAENSDTFDYKAYYVAIPLTAETEKVEAEKV